MSGRPRDPGVDDAILRATMELVEEKGYRAASIEGIAARAGVSKQTVYRRYRSKGEVILDALAAYAAGNLPAPDTASPRGDLAQLLTATFAAQQGIRGALNRALVAESIGDDDFARTVWERLILPRREVVRTILARARAPRELGDTEADFLVDLVYGPMWYRLLFDPPSLTAAYAERLAEAVTEMAAGGS
jgi:AcrR family transcriptional regulator